jgi:hypothetical protein
MNVSSCNGIEKEAIGGNALVVYPNPNNGEFNIESGGVEMEVSVVNQIGQLVQTVRLCQDNHFTTKLNDLSQGVYFISGQNPAQKITAKVIVIK